MLSPEFFYEINLKGKTADEISIIINDLKQEIKNLKNIVVHPKYQCTIHPSEQYRFFTYKSIFKEQKRHLLKPATNIYVDEDDILPHE